MLQVHISDVDGREELTENARATALFTARVNSTATQGSGPSAWAWPVSLRFLSWHTAMEMAWVRNKFGSPRDCNTTLAFLGGGSFEASLQAESQLPPSPAYPTGAASARISRTTKHSQ